MTTSFADWTKPESYCSAFTYTAQITSPTVVSLPASGISFVSSFRTFRISTTSASDAGAYTVTIYGAMGTA